MGGWWRDLRLAARKARRHPRAALMVVGVLGLGIGATTAVYSVVDGVMLRALPYPDAHRLVAVGVTFPGREWREDVQGLQYLAGVSYPNFTEVRDRARTLDRLVGLHRLGALIPDGPAGPELVGMMAVTEGFFETLGVRPHLGRVFGPDDFAGRTGAVTLLTYGTWMQRFGGDPDVIGRPVSSQGAAQIIVGVLPPDFQAPEAVAGDDNEFWVPLQLDHGRYESRGNRSLTLFGRLATGATLDEARTELDGLAADLARTWPEGNVYPDGTHFGWGANLLRAETVGATGRTLLIFLGAAGLLLAIAVLNATNLLFVRSLEGAGDRGVRTALGASRSSLVRQTVVEALVLALAGGLLGSGLAAAAVAAFRSLAPGLVPRMQDVSVDLRVLGAAVALSALVGVAAGLVPALRVGAGSVAQGLRRSAGAVAGGRTAWMDGVVAIQVALALVLVTGGTLLTRSFVELRSVDPGFDPEGLTTFSMGTKRGPDPEPAGDAWMALLDEVRAVPGVTAVAGASNLPYESPNWAPSLRRPGSAPDERMLGNAGYLVTPGYFEALGIPVLRGRGIRESDGPDDVVAVVVNQAFVDTHLAGEDPLGAPFLLGEEDTPAQVVGVVGNVVQTRAEEGLRPAVYLSFRQGEGWPWIRVMVRSDREPQALMTDLRAAGARYAAHLPVDRLSSMADRMARTRSEPRINMLLLAGFAGVALLLAAAGVYATLAHAVTLRRREMGIRMALGADAGAVLGLVLRRNLVLAVGGLAVGVAASWAATGVLGRYLFDVTARDPLSLALATLVLAAATLAAGLAPALRATRVDPTGSLRSP